MQTTPSLLRRIWRWPAVRYAIVTFAGLGIAAMLTGAIENWRGAQVWEECKRHIQQRGEILDIAAFLPPLVADRDNFASAPCLRKAMQRCDAEPEEISYRIGVYPRRFDGQEPKLGGWTTSEAMELKAWRDYYQRCGWLPPNPPADNAQAVLEALGRFDPEIAELHVISATRTRTRFSADYGHGYDATFPHFAAMRGFCQVLTLRAVVELRTERVREALADVLLGFRLMEAMETEPFLRSQLVRISMAGILLQPVWEGLVAHRWNQEQLTMLENCLARCDFAADFKRALRAERCSSTACFEKYYRATPWNEFRYRELYREFGTSLIYSFAPGGWIRQNMVFANRWYQACLDATPSDRTGYFLPERFVAADGIRTDAAMTPYTILGKFFLPEVVPVAIRSAFNQAQLNNAAVACMIERFRLGNGRVPVSLDELAIFVGKPLPHDIIGGGALHYGPTGEQSYVLYSIGWNRVDDHGRAKLQPGSLHVVDRAEGDWVWAGKRD